MSIHALAYISIHISSQAARPGGRLCRKSGLWRWFQHLDVRSKGRGRLEQCAAQNKALSKINWQQPVNDFGICNLPVHDSGITGVTLVIYGHMVILCTGVMVYYSQLPTCLQNLQYVHFMVPPSGRVTLQGIVIWGALGIAAFVLLSAYSWE